MYNFIFSLIFFLSISPFPSPNNLVELCLIILRLVHKFTFDKNRILDFIWGEEWFLSISCEQWTFKSFIFLFCYITLISLRCALQINIKIFQCLSIYCQYCVYKRYYHMIFVLICNFYVPYLLYFIKFPSSKLYLLFVFLRYIILYLIF